MGNTQCRNDITTLGGSALTLASNSEENDTAGTLNIGFDEPLDELNVPIITTLTYTSDQA